MIVLRFSIVFIFAALLSGCGDPALKEDVKAIKNDIAEFKKELKELKERAVPAIRAYLAGLPKPAPCPALGKHSDHPCAYKVTIIKTPDSPNSKYQGKVPENVAQSQIDECKQNHPFPTRCAKSGDDNPYEFFIDDPPQDLKNGAVVVCESQPHNDHLKCALEKLEKKLDAQS